MEKAALIWQHEKRNEVSVEVVAGHWKMAAKSSATLLAISALKKFGLITDRGQGDQRSVKLTELAYNILRAEPRSEAWLKAVQQAALSPKLIAELWETDKENPKSTPNLKKYLEFEKKFNPASIDQFVQTYRDTISFAKLGFGDNILTETAVDGDMETTIQNGLPVAPAAYKPVKPMVSSITAELPIPIAEGRVARVPYPMAEEDFNLFLETLKLWKKKLVKAPETSNPIPPKPAFPSPPFMAIWKGKNVEKMVKIIGQPWFEKGEWIFQDDKGTLVPAREITPENK